MDWKRLVQFALLGSSDLEQYAIPLVRVSLGLFFAISGANKLFVAGNTRAMYETLVKAKVPFPRLMTYFVSGVEFFGGLFLLAGLLSRISAGALGITMIVAIRSAKWADVDSLETLLGFDEFEYLALFLWIAIAGAGPLSVDHWLQRRFSPRGAPSVANGGAFGRRA